MKIIKELIIKCWDNEGLRYIFFGVCTTLVNQVCFYTLRFTILSNDVDSDRTVANFISVAAAIIFAYFVNAIFVFESRAVGLRGKLQEFVKFVGARLSTMVIEVGGVWLLVDKLKMNEFFIKTILIQVIVLILNYIFSKFLVFTKKDKARKTVGNDKNS